MKTELEQLVRDLLEKLQVAATVSVVEDDFGMQAVIESEESAALIGYRGGTLMALEYLVRTLMNRKSEAPVEVHVDVNGYRKQHVDEVRGLAAVAADKVVSSGQAEVLPPMNAYERRIVHTALGEDTRVKTESIGEGPHRRVVIKKSGE